MEYKLPERYLISNKSTYGRVLNIAGSDYMSGAAYLSCASALKMGCGYCYLASTDRVIDIVATKISNVVFLPFKKLKEYLQKADVVEIGCGLTKEKWAKDVFENVLKNIPKQTPLVIDADGLNILSEMGNSFTEFGLNNVILTPHPLEAARLLDCSIDEIMANQKSSAEEISKKYNCTTVFKIHKTIVYSRGRVYINNTGNSSLSKAGSGDVLTGIIAGLIAQHKSRIFESACLGVYLHGLCGELASVDMTEYSVMADDLLEYIPKAIKRVS